MAYLYRPLLPQEGRPRRRVTRCYRRLMARLGAKERAGLADSAFADVDASGRRRLPIHDAAHVRNALARFNQVQFDSEQARDRARTRLLKAASIVSRSRGVRRCSLPSLWRTEAVTLGKNQSST